MFSFNLVFVLCALLTYSTLADEIVVKNDNPKLFFRSENIDSSNVEDFLLCIFGITVESDQAYRIMHAKNPFSYAQAVVVVEDNTRSKWVEGPTSATYKIDDYVNWEDVESSVKLTLHKRLGKKVLTVYSPEQNSDEVIVGGTKYLNASLPEDRNILSQLAGLSNVVTKLTDADSLPVKTLLWISDENMAEMITKHGRDSKKFQEASDLFSLAIENVIDTLKEAYNDKTVSVLVTKEHNSVLRTRSLLQAEDEDVKETTPTPEIIKPKIPSSASENGKSTATISEAGNSNATIPNTTVGGANSDFAIVFNIVLWLSIILILALIAISYGIGAMDPGRDSIIYRMTSQRIKKEQ